VNKNEDIEDTLHQLSLDLRELENELFETKTKHEIMVSPMREYIEQWLMKALVKITETYQQEVGNSVMPPPAQQKIYKRHHNKQIRVQNFHHSKSSSHLVLAFTTFSSSVNSHFSFSFSKFVKTKG
jgi:hypothetical protein